MDRKIVLTLLAAALFAFVGIWLLLSLMPDERATVRQYPWEVAHDEAGRVQVFGLTLGASTLADLRQTLGEDGKLSLFAQPDGSFSAEAYFNDVMLSNLRADWVVPLKVAQVDLAAMYARGLRISKLGSGSHKVRLDPDDALALAAVPVRAITYLPWKRLPPEDLEGRFGAPAERLAEAGGIEHWLYPARGMDIARDARGGVVIQYLNPDDFAAARAPLQAPPATTLRPSDL
ncbi:MAG: hypothetical protein EA400_01930 [Chromatiaceae bacterium]|nr:MAG: hypothetical protein EA400_01930 [Chromatiaceae bacterium]